MLAQKEIFAQKRTINNGKIEVIAFVAKPSNEIFIVDQVWGRGYRLRCFWNFKFTRVDEFELLWKLIIFRDNTSSVYKTELFSKAFSPTFIRPFINSAHTSIKQVGK